MIQSHHFHRNLKKITRIGYPNMTYLTKYDTSNTIEWHDSGFRASLTSISKISGVFCLLIYQNSLSLHSQCWTTFRINSVDILPAFH